VQVRRSGDAITVSVAAVVHPFGSGLRHLPGTPVAAHATAIVEGRR
jgi:hypothetical protein